MTQAMHRVLLIEDDRAISQVLTLLFETDGFRVVAVETCALGVRQAQSQRPDICIVDLGLPDRDGLNFILQTRRWSPVALIVLTARAQEADRLAAFEAGADDYVMKPFYHLELLARMRAIMRRTLRIEQPNSLLTLGTATIDLANRVTRTAAGEETKLTPLEHRMLEALVRRAGSIVTHQALMREVWGPHQTDVRALRVCLSTLRQKLERDPAQPEFLLTEPGVGYRLLVTKPQQSCMPVPNHAAHSVSFENHPAVAAAVRT